MLSFNIRSLIEHAVMVDDELPLDDPVWQDDDIRPSAPLRVVGRLSPAGPGRYYWHGSIDGEVSLECSRCLGPAQGHVHDETHLIFADSGAEGVEEDPDVFQLSDDADELDLRPAVREQWLLNVPAYALCRDDCQGICATCGAELNLGPCNCRTSSTDPRWSALKKLQESQG